MLIEGYEYIAEEDFRINWGAHGSASGDLYCWSEARQSPREQVWTVFESEAPGDGNWYASPGIGIINALGYLKTSRAWNADTPDAVWFIDD